MTRSNGTFDKILQNAKAHLINTGLGTSSNIRISLEQDANYPVSPAGSSLVWVLSPGAEWKRDLGVVLGDEGEIILEGNLNFVCWIRAETSEQVGTDENVLTNPVIGTQDLITRTINEFDLKNAEAANLCDASLVSPLMESLTLTNVILSKRNSGTPWHGFVVIFRCMFRLQTR